MTDHDSGAKDQAGEGGAVGSTATNVVPFPRTWYGSVEELVPINPEPPQSSVRSDPVADASAFWGGDTAEASVGHGAPAEHSAAPPSSEEARWEWQDDLEFDHGPCPDGDERRHDGRGLPRGVPAETRQRTGEPRRRVRAVLALALIGLLVSVISVAALNGGGTGKHGRASATARRPALTVTQTIPQTTTVVQTVTTRSKRPARHRQEHREKPARVSATKRQITTTPASDYHPSTSQPPSTSSPSPSDAPPASSSPSRSYTPPASSSPSRSYTPPASSSPSRSYTPPASSSPSRSYTPPASSGRTHSSSRSSKAGCAPSATNGGACSL